MNRVNIICTPFRISSSVFSSQLHLLRRGSEGNEAIEVLAEGAPDWVQPVERLQGDVEALLELCSNSTLSRRRVKVDSINSVFNIGGDASKVGYRSVAQQKTRREKPVKTFNRVGFWVESIRDGKRCKWKELRNCVGSIEQGVMEGRLQGCKVFMFTDNSAVERAFYNGTSSDKHLFELVLRLRKTAMQEELIVHVIHIAGTRMIKMSIDGLSRGDTHEGVAAGRNIVEFMDLHKDAFTRSPSLQDWWQETWREDLWGKLHELSKEEWFTHYAEMGQVESVFWLPPPAAADVCVKQLAFWRQHSLFGHAHVFICPRLFTCLWRKQLGKVCDILIKVPILCLERVWGTYPF